MEKTNLQTAGIGIRFEQRILEKDNPNVEVGKIKYNYTDDWSIDYEYAQGEVFRYEDCIDGNQRLRIQEVYQECCNYFDALVDLFEEVYSQIHSQISLLPSLIPGSGKPDTKPSTNKISMDNYFSVV